MQVEQKNQFQLLKKCLRCTVFMKQILSVRVAILMLLKHIAQNICCAKAYGLCFACVMQYFRKTSAGATFRENIFKFFACNLTSLVYLCLKSQLQLMFVFISQHQKCDQGDRQVSSILVVVFLSKTKSLPTQMNYSLRDPGREDSTLSEPPRCLLPLCRSVWCICFSPNFQTF